MNSALDNGNALIISYDAVKEEELLKSILGELAPQQSVDISAGITGYQWHIDTKYYSTDIHLCTTTNTLDSLHDPDFASSVCAVIFIFDNTLECVDSWLPYLNSCNAEIQLLVCDKCEDSSSSGLPRQKILEWCIKNRYELIELIPDQESNDEYENDFKETTGIERVIQALHSHTWPNLKLKDGPSYVYAEENISQKPLGDIIGSNDELLNVLDGDDSDDVSFDQLFQNFCQLKEKASSLPFEERKKYAEKVAISFWKAVGGDEDEIADLED